VQITVEQVDLVYLVLPPGVVPSEQFSEIAHRTAPPVWRFHGQDKVGDPFEVYVLAAVARYVADE
jgi:hypothetical protein